MKAPKSLRLNLPLKIGGHAASIWLIEVAARRPFFLFGVPASWMYLVDP